MGFLLTTAASVVCAHAGQAQPAAPNPRVKAAKQATILQTAAYQIAGCGLTGTGSPPCATAQWITGSTRVTSNGQALLTTDGQSICMPTGTPLTVAAAQPRVKAL